MFRFAGLVVGILLTASAQAVSINSGAVAYQVFQCDDAGQAAIALSGSAANDGPVWVTVTDGVQTIITPQELAAVENGAWSGILEGVPAGGPYTLKVYQESGAADAVPGILVGDIWVLAGQSNMQGVGNLDVAEPPHAQVHAFRMSHQWQPAREPLHILAESPDQVHFDHAKEDQREQAIRNSWNGAKGAGLGLAFGREMVARTGRPVGLICAAHGGTSMEQWNPARRDEGGASLYGSMYKQVQAAGGKVRGVLWYQGESDANEKAAALYRDAMKTLVASMRSDFNAPELPFYYVQIGRFAVDMRSETDWNAIQRHQLALESELVPGGLVASVDLALDDLIHIGTPGLKTLGERLAVLAEGDLFEGAHSAGPRIESATAVQTPQGMRIDVKLSGVNGRLQSEGRLSGFSVCSGPEGEVQRVTYKEEITGPDTVAVWVQKLPENAHLWYGRGLDPYANLVDEANMALPVSGPIAIAGP